MSSYREERNQVKNERRGVVCPSIPRTQHAKKNTRRWCKGIEGRKHNYQPGTRRSYVSSFAVEYCANCGKEHYDTERIKLRREFANLADEWERGTRHRSTWAQISKHAACAKLIAKGHIITPLILRRLRRQPDFAWSMLLLTIARTDLVYIPEIENGLAKFDVKAMSEAWVRWGIEQGLIAE